MIYDDMMMMMMMMMMIMVIGGDKWNDKDGNKTVEKVI